MADDRGTGGFLQIEDYGLIGDMHTCALVAQDGSIDFMCWPDFDSPSLFCRLLDGRKGGHWSIRPIFPPHETFPVCKQQYIASSNLLQTRWIHESGVVALTDFFAVSGDGGQLVASLGQTSQQPLPTRNSSEPTFIRRLECLRGEMDIKVDIFPQPDYARRGGRKYHFRPTKTRLNDRYASQSIAFADNAAPSVRHPAVHVMCTDVEDAKAPEMFTETGLGPLANSNGVQATFHLTEGQQVVFVLCEQPVPADEIGKVLFKAATKHELQTRSYWTNWVHKCRYRGRFQQEVERSLLLLKLLTFRPSGAIVASPTFSLPEAIGGTRNWDYRYSWVRDSSFTVYVFLKMGFIDEAEAYITFIFDRMQDWTQAGANSPLPLMFSINGDSDLPELELEHLDGYKNTKPVRIGNAATGHIQLDIYGELMDSIYLYNKHGKPITYDQWVSIRHLINYLSTCWSEPDMSIWEVRGRKEHFVYSKIMLWVAFDRALRLADKRCFPCQERHKWLEIRDTIYEQVMTKGYNRNLKSFIQSYESPEVLDAAVLIAPLVFFIAPNDPRFQGTLDQVLKSPEKGGLTSAGLVFRYNHTKVDDGESSLYVLLSYLEVLT